MTHHPLIPLLLLGVLFPSLSYARPPGPPPPDPVAKTLDRDRDRELSAREIDDAPRALLKLDEDGDDALSREELRPKPPRGERRGPRGGGGEGRPQGPRGGEEEGRPQGPPRPSPLLRALDGDRDGALSADEIDAASEALLELDEDGDGAVSAEELGMGRRPPPPGGRERGPER